jgi:hypothetical protein
MDAEVLVAMARPLSSARGCFHAKRLFGAENEFSPD